MKNVIRYSVAAVVAISSLLITRRLLGFSEVRFGIALCVFVIASIHLRKDVRALFERSEKPTEQWVGIYTATLLTITFLYIYRPRRAIMSSSSSSGSFRM